MGIAPTAHSNGDVEMADEPVLAEGLPKEAADKITTTSETLSASRKKRKAPADYASAQDVKAYIPKHTIPSLHSASPSGITSLALSKSKPSQFLTGGNDKVVQLYDRDTDKVLASLKGHTKKINHVALRESEGQPTLLLSAGADKIAKIWAYDDASAEYIPKSTIRTHKGEVTGLAVHPTNDFLALSSTDKTYSVHDLSNFVQVFQSHPADDPFTSLSIHPDGTLLALGTSSSTVEIYDIRTGAAAATLRTEGIFNVHTLSFSENGYHLLAPNSTSSVAIWDLRKQKTAHSIALGDDFKIAQVIYDVSALYFGVAGSAGGRVFAHKTWDELLRLEEGGEMTALCFGESGKEIWGSTGREIRIWGNATT